MGFKQPGALLAPVRETGRLVLDAMQRVGRRNLGANDWERPGGPVCLKVGQAGYLGRHRPGVADHQSSIHEVEGVDLQRNIWVARLSLSCYSFGDVC